MATAALKTSGHTHTINDQMRIRLRQAMREKGWNSIQLAMAADVKTSFLYDVLSGKSLNPSVLKLARVAKALGVELEYLAGMPPVLERIKAEDNPIGRIKYTSGKICSYYDPELPVARFNSWWLQTCFQIEPEHARIFVVENNDMLPLFKPRDIVLIDVLKNTPEPGIFLLYSDSSLSIRKIEAISEPLHKVRLSFNHPSYSTEERCLDDISIIGRIVWASGTI